MLSLSVIMLFTGNCLCSEEPFLIPRVMTYDWGDKPENEDFYSITCPVDNVNLDLEKVSVDNCSHL